MDILSLVFARARLRREPSHVNILDDRNKEFEEIEEGVMMDDEDEEV